jgi:hypothetical protein
MSSEPQAHEELKVLADIGEAVQSLTRNGWRIVTDEISEKHSVNGGDVLRSLKLELRKGPLTLSG